MVAVKISDLVLLLLLLVSTRAAIVTWRKCHTLSSHLSFRILDARPDQNATVLYLDDCQITHLQPGDFEGLPNLTKIHLNHNQIETLGLTAFSAVNRIKELYLEYNKLIEVPNFGEHSLFPNMKILSLNSNEISNLDNPEVFSSLLNLERIQLRHNRITHLHPDVFKGLNKLKSIVLSTNKITYIPDGFFHAPSLEYIYLTKNYIRYIAPGAINSIKLKNLDLMANRLTHLPEHFLLGLKNASANFTTIHLHMNSWQCACLREVTAEASSCGVRIMLPSHCESGSDPNQCKRPSLEEALAAF